MIRLCFHRVGQIRLRLFVCSTCQSLFRFPSLDAYCRRAVRTMNMRDSFLYRRFRDPETRTSSAYLSLCWLSIWELVLIRSRSVPCPVPKYLSKKRSVRMRQYRAEKSKLQTKLFSLCSLNAEFCTQVYQTDLRIVNLFSPPHSGDLRVVPEPSVIPSWALLIGPLVFTRADRRRSRSRLSTTQSPNSLGQLAKNLHSTQNLSSGPTLPTFCNRKAIVDIGVSALKSFIGDDVGHEHSALEVDGIGARRNADAFEFAAHSVVTDTAGFLFAGNEMQLPASVAHNSIPYWHAAIILRRLRDVQGWRKIPITLKTRAVILASISGFDFSASPQTPLSWARGPRL